MHKYLKAYRGGVQKKGELLLTNHVYLPPPAQNGKFNHLNDLSLCLFGYCVSGTVLILRMQGNFQDQKDPKGYLQSILTDRCFENWTETKYRCTTCNTCCKQKIGAIEKMSVWMKDNTNFDRQWRKAFHWRWHLIETWGEGIPEKVDKEN